MALTYHTRHLEDQDVIDPADWVQNHADIAGEFNGHLDRDNVPELGVTVDRIAPGTFHTVDSDEGVGPVAVTGGAIGWQDVCEVHLDVDCDCVIEADWGGIFSWTTAPSEPNVGIRLLIDGSLGHQIPRVYVPLRRSFNISGVANASRGIVRVVGQMRLFTDVTSSPVGKDADVSHYQIIAVARTR